MEALTEAILIIPLQFKTQAEYELIHMDKQLQIVNQ